jgi:membrane-associated phospholipid phosphatase
MMSTATESSAVAEALGRPATVVPATDGATAARRRRTLLRWGGPAAYLAALGTEIADQGLPLMRDRLLLWIVLGLIAFSLADPRRVARGLVVEWLPFGAVLLAYDRLRGMADELLFRAHTWPQLHFDERLFGGVVPTVRLQHALYHGPDALRWYDYGTWAVYMSHFFATLVVAMALWLVARRHFRRYAAMVSLLALVGFATYALFPAVPPWLAGQQGALPEVDRLVGVVWSGVGLSVMGPLFEKGTEYSNQVAAMPSLHAAYALLIALFLWPLARRWWWRGLLAAYPPAMGFALVYSGEHYVADVLMGWIYAAAVFLAVEAVARRRSARRARLPAVLLARHTGGDRFEGTGAGWIGPPRRLRGASWRSQRP